ncbi:MAG: endonuclease MutS2 [Myxococcota bacterium]
MGFECDARTLERLEWPGLVAQLASRTVTARGVEACGGDLFAPAPEAMREWLAQTSELRGLLAAGVDLPLAGVEDLREMLGSLARGVPPLAGDLAGVLRTLRAAERVRRRLEEHTEQAPRLAALGRSLPMLSALADRLARTVTREGELRDGASRELARLRRQLRSLEGEISERMSACLRAPSIRPHLQDHYVTSRENRPVLPVRADARQRVPGIVHDVSSSGTTVFIEPQSVVELSNRLRMARTALEREIERLLRELGTAVHGEHESLERLGAGLEALDLARARAVLSRDLDAVEPEVGEDAPLALLQLRHPLLMLEAGLDAAEVVPNDVRLPERARGVVISGPNAGGKTVLAKAVGLAVLAARAGLHVPCAPGSQLPLIRRVCADIGDEQDLRSGLSTFSARMANLAGVVSGADARTLVIVDEIGEGTEPGEGAALAQAILEALVARGAWVLATTHFDRLKELAGADERFVNASAEFDRETLLPTYRLRMGTPGSSGAIWVAQRMGLEDVVVERSRELLDDEDRRLEALMRSLSELRQELEAERRAAAETREATESVRRDYERRLETLRGAREKALARMRSELEAAYEGAREEIAEVMRTLQRGTRPDGRAASRAQHEIEEIRTRTEAVERIHRPPPAPAPLPPGGILPGMRVHLAQIAEAAVVLEPPDRRGRLAVRVGAVRMTVPVTRVRGLAARVEEDARASPVVAVARACPDEAIEFECDLRGLRVDEAIDHARAHLDRVRSAGLREARFIHGHGTGALREAIRAWLRELPEVGSFEAAAPEHGGTGVTVATLSD